MLMGHFVKHFTWILMAGEIVLLVERLVKTIKSLFKFIISLLFFECTKYLSLSLADNSLWMHHVT